MHAFTPSEDEWMKKHQRSIAVHTTLSTQTGTWSPGHLGPMVHQSTADKMASQLPRAHSETKASASNICEESGNSLFFSLKWKNRDARF